VLRAYLQKYFQTLVTPQQEELRLTLVDGLAGGGVYQHETIRSVVLGSPFVFLNAAKEWPGQPPVLQGSLLNQRVHHSFLASDTCFCACSSNDCDHV
jgi:three-Cys-motif partner protein